MTQRPFRSPHHTISDVALVGGGTNPQPEKSLLLITEFFSSMNCRNSSAVPWR